MICRNALRRPAAFSLAVALGCFLVQGCAPTSDCVPVRGVVLLDGKPLSCGIVQFQPASGQPAAGEIASDGTFALSRHAPADGVPPGTYRVSVLAYDPQASERSDEHLLVPLKYTRFGTSGIEFTVFPGNVEAVVISLASDEATASSPVKGVDGDHSAAAGSDS
jgi:hypothetical protein